jgi:ribose 5-phosphate isomerase B
METIIIGADHAGFSLKESLIEHFKEQGIPYQDCGCYDPQSVDYPEIANRVVQAMAQQDPSFSQVKGVLCCGSGVGVSIAANRHPQIRAVLSNDLYTAKMSRQHNDANVLCMGSRIIAPALAIEIFTTWIHTSFEGGRHQRRVEMLSSSSSNSPLTPHS